MLDLAVVYGVLVDELQAVVHRVRRGSVGAALARHQDERCVCSAMIMLDMDNPHDVQVLLMH
jgi:hypothetical protein